MRLLPEDTPKLLVISLINFLIILFIHYYLDEAREEIIKDLCKKKVKNVKKKSI